MRSCAPSFYDTHNSLAAKGRGASEEHWRELCMQIAKSADDTRVGRRISPVLPALTPHPPLPRKATIVEQLSKYREDLERAREAVEGRRGGKGRMINETEAETEAAAEWREKCDRVIEARNHPAAVLFAAEATSAETEEDTEKAQVAIGGIATPP